jgi:hypothetical protein
MAADNHTTIVGNLVEDPEVRFTNNGIAVTNLRVAVTQRIQQDGQWRDGDTASQGQRVARPGREPRRILGQGRPGHGHRPAAAAQLGHSRGGEAVGHRAGGRRGRGLPEVGHGQGGPAESRVTLSCRSFAPSEQVEVTLGATVLATAKAAANGQVAASFAVPGGFAGSTIPGRRDTFQAKGRQSGRAASATLPWPAPARASCVLAPATGPAGSRVSLSCRGFAPSEQVVVTFGAEGLATATATTGDQVAASLWCPAGLPAPITRDGKTLSWPRAARAARWRRPRSQ